jgi:type VI secretion system protein ImpJ
MVVKNKIIWLEGMALEPQLFQQQDKYFANVVDYKLSLIRNNLWGFRSLELDNDLLTIGKLSIAQASGMFEDGTIFDIPNTDAAPIPLTISEKLNNTVIYLALPLKHVSVADAGNEQSEQTYRYEVISKEIINNLADNQETATISVGSLVCRLLTEHDNLDGYTYLPIVKLKEVGQSHQISFDKAFMTTWLDVQQAEPLKKFVEEVRALLTNRAEMLANRLADMRQAGSTDVNDLNLLQLSNKYEAIFSLLAHKSPLHPEILYFNLVEMLSEVTTYTTQKRRPMACAIYRHHHLFETFKPLIKDVRQALRIVLEQNATAITLEAREHGLWSGQINDKSLLTTCNFVLAVYADMSLEELRTGLPARIKIAPIEKIQILVSKALPGISLTSLAIPPRHIPYHQNFCYFGLETRELLWQELSDSAAIALHISGDIPSLKLELWAIKTQ